MGKNMCRVGYIITFSLRRCGFALRVRPLAKQLLDVRLTNWQLFAGGRGAVALRRPRRGDVCAVLRLCHAWVRTYPGAEREDMWHVDRKSPQQWKKSGAFNEKYASSCTKRHVFRIFLPVGRPQGSCFAVRWGVPSSEGTRCERRRGKREAFHCKKSPLQGRGCTAKGNYSKCAARWGAGIRLDVADGRDR